MHLKSITLKGFKSFPDRTRLEFGPGVSVIVGPNGSGKSNVTDAVLWALGEQSPLAVRGQSMQDVIFGGARGQQARGAAEVELVIDNGDGAAGVEFSEIAISRRLDRNGEGEYRLNGARCRLVDVLEALSDTGLGKEMHSVVSQGRVEAIVTSKPRDRRLLIEEAAGLGKHRKRRRRAQLKLERTQDNLDRLLDVEREARSRLRPLKRQAEAAELHERLERQSTEARWELARDRMRETREGLTAAEAAAAAARAARDEVERELATVAKGREEAEEALSRRSEERERLSGRAFAARSAHERAGLRLEQARSAASGVSLRAERLRSRIDAMGSEQPGIEGGGSGRAGGMAGEGGGSGGVAEMGAERPGIEGDGSDRIAELEAALAGLERERSEEVERQVAELGVRLEAARAAVEAAEGVVEARRSELASAEAACEASREERGRAESAVEAARRESARVGADLAAVNHFLRAQAAAPGGEPALADVLDVEPGYELAVAAALGGRLRAAVVPDLGAARDALDKAGTEGGSALVTGAIAIGPHHGAKSRSDPESTSAVAIGPDSRAQRQQRPGPGPDGEQRSAPSPPSPAAVPAATSPAPGAEPLATHLRGDGDTVAFARHLLANAWVVDNFDALDDAFQGTAVTRTGRAWFAAWRELRQAPEGGEDRVLAERHRRDELISATETAATAERTAAQAAEDAAAAVARTDEARAEADRALRDAVRTRDVAAEDLRRAEWLIEQRRTAPDEGPAGIRRAEVVAALAAERRLAEQAARAREAHAERLAAARVALERCEALAPAADRTIAALEGLESALAGHLSTLEAELAADRASGEELAATLRGHAHREADLQGRLRERGEAVTVAEVSAQQARDQSAEAESELRGLAAKLELPAQPAEEALPPEEREALAARIERLARRREQLGPVNPLAQNEYAEALAHVEELETQRTDLETAMRELQSLISETDRRIREAFETTFEAAAANFEELVGQLFPGGRGRLRLVKEDDGPKRVLGGQATPDEAAGDDEPEPEEPEDKQEEDVLGVEIEMTPAGKAMKRLSLLSGGEKSLTALAFLFAVFLARPCPFYVLDEVEAALDDLNIDRFLTLLRRHADRAQFIVVTHQKRTMEAADTLYGVSMGDDGISRVISRKLPAQEREAAVA
ncbi:MAG: chromosome segregation protein [Solirubrobacteraceae bacterium]|nr:chromosome segregation protein [Solirubrobacteraceae bacterium]